MKAIKSNSKLVFAYQQKESYAAYLNDNLNPNASGSSVIRVVQARDASTVVTTANYDPDSSDPRLHIAADTLTSAYIVKIQSVSITGVVTDETFASTYKALHTLQHNEAPNHVIIDIELSQYLDDALADEDKLYRAVIGLKFQSGAVESLILNLRSPYQCFMQIEPEQLGIDSEATIYPTVDTASTGFSSGGLFTSYSISKAYVKASEKADSIRNYYYIGNNGFHTFSYPFGVVRGASQIAPNSGPAWTPPSTFVSENHSSMRWYTGDSDMTQLLATTANTSEQSTDSGISINKFFSYKDQLNESIDSPVENYLYSAAVPNTGWGQKYGWFSDLQDGTIYDADGGIAVEQQDQNFGVPPVWREEGQLPNQAGGSIPKALFGVFSDNSGVADVVNYNASNNSAFPLALKTRYARLLSTNTISSSTAPITGYVPGTNVPTDKIIAAPNYTNYSNSYIPFYTQDWARQHFYFIPLGNISTSNMPTNGSLSSLTTNFGANFFYAGNAGTATTSYEAVFKGIIRSTYINRFGATIADGVGIVNEVVTKIYDQDMTSQVHDLASLAVGGGEAVTYHNPIDIFTAALYHHHVYPSRPNDSITIAVGDADTKYFQVAHKLLRGTVALQDPDSTSDAFSGAAQDIVFLNIGCQPTKYDNSLTGRISSIVHPIKSVLEVNPTTTPWTSANHNIKINNASVTSSSSQSSSVPIAHTDRYKDSIHSTPPYPVNINDAYGDIPEISTHLYANTAAYNSSNIYTINAAFSKNHRRVDLGNMIYNSDGNFRIFRSSVEVSGVNSDLSIDETSNDIKITYSLVYYAVIAGMQTSGGSYTVTGGTLAERVASVLEIFPTIQYNPLAALEQTSNNSQGLAYKTIVEDENDVDDIKIEALEEPNTYKLTVEFKADATDIYQSPDDDITIDINIPNTAVWPDAEKIAVNDNGISTNSYGEYANLEGEDYYTKFKSSFITVATVTDWLVDEVHEINTFGNAAKGNDPKPLFAYHHAFLVVGSKDQNEIETVINDTVVYGCTDSNASNYNPEANTDNGSCEYCNDSSSNSNWNLTDNGIATSSGGMRIGVNSQAVVGAMTGQGSIASSLLPQSAYIPDYLRTSPAAYWGGAALVSANYFGESVDETIELKATCIGSALEPIIESAFGITSGSSNWTLRIFNAPDGLEDVDFDYSSPQTTTTATVAGLGVSDAIYGSITGATPTDATDILAPRWTIPGGTLQAGRLYVTELRMVINTSADVTCTDFNPTYRIYGMFWTAFCSCANTTNEYFNTAMVGQGYEWNVNNVSSFPIVAYNAGNNCPDTPGIPLGDLQYPEAVCFQPDDQITTCDDLFLYCVLNSDAECQTTITDLEDAYQASNGNYYYNYSNYSIAVLIEGVWNGPNDQYQFVPGLEYSITVTNGANYIETQTQDNATIETGGFQHTFSGMVEPGTYTVTWTFNNINGNQDLLYTQYFTDTPPCQLSETVTVPEPVDLCGEIITGCTDPEAGNYDALATFDDGSCLPPDDPCSSVWNNDNLVTTPTAVNSTSTCTLDQILYEGTQIEANIITPDNNGSVTASINYTAPTASGDEIVLSSSAFAVLLFSESTTIPGLTNVIDSTSAIFSSGIYPTATTGGQIQINDLQAWWSPLFDMGPQDATYTFTFTNLPPAVYYIVPIPNFSPDVLTECSDLGFITYQEYVQTITVGMDDPTVACEEPCQGIDCAEYTTGCTDPQANNYDPEASLDDGSCEYTSTFCEENPTDALCIDCTDAGQAPVPRISSGNLDTDLCDPVTGSEGYCTDPNACNYSPDAPLELTNNQLCDYCSCVGTDDVDCNDDTDCDPALDPNCQPPEPECPDPGNPNCDPDIFDPCPGDECGPPLDPCIVLGNCPQDDGDGDDEPDVVIDDEVETIELTCIPDVAGVETAEGYWDNVLQKAFQCVSEEGKKMMFKMKAGVEHDRTDLLKISLITYLLNGGTDNSELPCIFNCNYESAELRKTNDCVANWAAKGFKFYNSTDTYAKGDVVLYYYLRGGVMTRNYYTATRTITPIDPHPRYPQSGWHRCQNVRARTVDTNQIATGNETYLNTFWEFITRYCSECSILTDNTQASENVVDPKILKNYLDRKQDPEDFTGNASGILGEDGEEIIF